MPSTALLGLQTPSGWTITQELTHKQVSGGNFCSRYIAEKDGQVGFLKAMDLKRALEDPSKDPLRELQKIVNEYVFEREILDYCKDLKMSRVVTPLDAGEIKVPNHQPPLNTVYYVIFERANNDLRQQHLDADKQNWLLAFTALHHVTLGVGQLHRAGIAHQDIKPSNILCFSDSGSKVSDLGRVTDEGNKSPFSHFPFTGDGRYMPPEFMHRFIPSEFSDRLFADMFMVGSLTYQLVTGVQMWEVLRKEAQKTQPRICSLPWDEALPMYLTAFNTILGRFHEECILLFNNKIADLLRTIVLEMCHPDPYRRGAPKRTLRRAKLAMDRYTGLLSSVIRIMKTELVFSNA